MRRWFVWIAGLSAVCSLGRPALCQPATGAPLQPQIHKEWALGKQMGQDLDRRDGRINDPALTQYIQRIENRLAVAAGQKPPEIRLTRSSEIYATALDDSVQYLSGGLVQRLENEMELAGLLAHQLAHRQVSGISSTQGASTPLHGPPCVLSPLGTAGEGGLRRDQEEQASARALGYLKAAGYDPEGLLDLFSKLAYEHPAWAQAIVPEDLLSLRSGIEDEEPPSSGYRVNTSEFSERHDKMQAFLGHASDKRQDNQNPPTLTRR
jgi:predicted Zn-dependent protease